MKKLSLVTGIFIFLFSLFTVSLRYNHFYELMLIGLFLMLHFLLHKTITYKKREVYILYIVFFLSGISVDLPAQFFHLWHYTYKNIFEYAFLYFIAYPLGGFVMLYSYFFVSSKIHIGSVKKRQINQTIFWFLIFLSALVLTTIIISIKLMPFPRWSVICGIAILFFSGTVINTISDKLYKQSFIRDLYQNQSKTIVAALITTYINTVIHELPNTYAPEWVYTMHTYSFLDGNFLNVPILAWLTWPALTIGPISIYYLVHNFLKSKNAYI